MLTINASPLHRPSRLTGSTSRNLNKLSKQGSENKLIFSHFLLLGRDCKTEKKCIAANDEDGRFPFNWSDIIFGRTASGSAEKTVTAPRSLFASLSLNRRCKKSPLSLRPRASQRIVISFCPQAASLSLGREPAKCVHKSTKAQSRANSC